MRKQSNPSSVNNHITDKGSTSSDHGDMPILLFKWPKDWAAWLDTHQGTSSGVWLQLAKKASDIQSVSYREALEVALCYGWIDGQKKSCDDVSWLQKFTPRGARSIWSKINRETALKLIKDGRMKPAGLEAVERAKQSGRWAAAYDSPGRAAVPDDFQAELNRNAHAKAFFATLNSANRYAILFRLQTAKKAETRAQRIRQFIEMLDRHEQLHP
jgi:uncharacterized protein YdeI (YjbR/CyaY-like superfamily)